jgi:hypothetical protein
MTIVQTIRPGDGETVVRSTLASVAVSRGGSPAIAGGHPLGLHGPALKSR